MKIWMIILIAALAAITLVGCRPKEEAEKDDPIIDADDAGEADGYLWRASEITGDVNCYISGSLADGASGEVMSEPLQGYVAEFGALRKEIEGEEQNEDISAVLVTVSEGEEKLTALAAAFTASGSALDRDAPEIAEWGAFSAPGIL